jgi:hypothetical protein
MCQPSPITFACDAMLGGLARWLRAAGYDATWKPDISDWDLIRTARYEDRTLLTSDTGIFRWGVIRDGDIPAPFVPHGLGILDQLTFVLQQLHLPIREPRRICRYNTQTAGVCPRLTWLPSQSHLQGDGIFDFLIVKQCKNTARAGMNRSASARSG